MLFKKKIFNKVVDEIITVLTNNNYGKVIGNCTIDGKQSENIIALFPEKILKDILFFNNFYKKLFHIHYIEYDKGGYQEAHNHEKTEKFSFILYLNDSDGDTFFCNPYNISIKPEKGLLVVFSSDIMHYSFKSFKNKKVLVGAIDKK